jgi:hypothetical protein
VLGSVGDKVNTPLHTFAGLSFGPFKGLRLEDPAYAPNEHGGPVRETQHGPNSARTQRSATGIRTGYLGNHPPEAAIRSGDASAAWLFWTDTHLPLAHAIGAPTGSFPPARSNDPPTLGNVRARCAR